MNTDEIKQKIGVLSDAERAELFRICEERRKANKGANTAVYVEGVPESTAAALDAQGLVWLGIANTVAAIHPVYRYYENGIAKSMGS